MKFLPRSIILEAIQAQPVWPAPWPAHEAILYLLRYEQRRYVAQANAYVARCPVTVLHAQVARGLLWFEQHGVIERVGDAPSRTLTGRTTTCSWWRRMP